MPKPTTYYSKSYILCLDIDTFSYFFGYLSSKEERTIPILLRVPSIFRKKWSPIPKKLLINFKSSTLILKKFEFESFTLLILMSYDFTVQKNYYSRY